MADLAGKKDRIYQTYKPLSGSDFDRTFHRFYFFSMWLSREKVFDMAVDPGIVRGLLKRWLIRFPFPIMMIGLLIYLMLFEFGARYVYIFLPIMIVMSFCGMNEADLVLRSSNHVIRP